MIKKLMMINIRKYVTRYFYRNDMPVDEWMQHAKTMSEFIYSGELPQKKGAKA